MGTQASPNIVIPLRDLSDGSLDSGKTVELIPYGNTYPSGAIALTEIGVTGVYKKEAASGIAAVAQGVYLVYVNTNFAGTYAHGGEFLQSHIDDVADPHAVAGSQVAIADSGGYFSTDEVEAALQELGAHKTATNDPHGIKSSQINDDSALFLTSAIAAEINAKKYLHLTGSINQGNTPAPDKNGGGTTWVEISVPNDLSNHPLDSDIDYRQRIITITAYIKPEATAGKYLPGGASEGSIQANRNSVSADNEIEASVFFSNNGQDGLTSIPAGFLQHGSGSEDNLLVFALNTDGSLQVKKEQLTNNSTFDLILKIDYSPKQNH